VQLGQEPIRINEGLLRHIFCQVEITQEGIGIPKGHVLESTYNRAERVHVTALGCYH